MSNAEGKRIRFIDSNYNNLFTLPDGRTLYLRYANGEKKEYTCEYLGECHLKLGHDVLHICQLAEIMGRNRTVYAPIQPPNNMPYRCYGIS